MELEIFLGSLKEFWGLFWGNSEFWENFGGFLEVLGFSGWNWKFFWVPGGIWENFGVILGELREFWGSFGVLRGGSGIFGVPG